MIFDGYNVASHCVAHLQNGKIHCFPEPWHSFLNCEIIHSKINYPKAKIAFVGKYLFVFSNFFKISNTKIALEDNDLLTKYSYTYSDYVLSSAYSNEANYSPLTTYRSSHHRKLSGNRIRESTVQPS